MPHYTITVELDGTRHSGTWSIKQGYKICVSCGWGAETVDCGDLRPEECAKRTLARIVKAGMKERSDELKRRQREVAKVHAYWDKQRL